MAATVTETIRGGNMGVWTAIGVGTGAAVGVATGDLAVWSAVGIASGVALGSISDQS